MVNQENLKRQNVKYELEPPDGGWGYLVTVALTIACNVTVVPMAAFGLIYGKFLADIGDETTGTTLANGIFNTLFNITGLAASSMLQTYSYRLVGFIGAVLYFTGSFCLIFVSNLWQMILFFGVIQGLGMGLIFPACFTALNSYFNKKLNLMNSLAQAVMVITTMAFPPLIQCMMNNLGFRGTVAILSALSLNTVLAASILQPAEWHMKKKIISLSINDTDQDAKDPLQIKPLLTIQMQEEVEKFILPKPRTSIISVGDRALSVTTINRLGELEGGNINCLQSFIKSFDFSLFKDIIYINISLGLALSFTADVAFISLIPLVLYNAGFENGDITLMMTIYFGADFAGRILLSVLSALFRIKNRYYFLIGAFCSALFRTGFVMSNTLWWKISMLSILGFLRAFIQTPLPLVISDQYSNNFSTAFSLYMVVCGIVSLIFGPLLSYVKYFTNSDVMVVHLLSLAYLTTAVSWICELLFTRKIKSDTIENNKV